MSTSSDPDQRSSSSSPGLGSTSTGVTDGPLNPISHEVEKASTEKRISFYVQAAEDMLEAVLGPLEREGEEDEEYTDGIKQGREAYLFSVEERRALRRWREASYQTKYLFIRLYLRKSKWIRMDSLDGRKGYEIGKDIEDLKGAAEELWKVSAPRASRTPSFEGKGKGKMKEEDIAMLVLNSSPPTESKPTPSKTSPSVSTSALNTISKPSGHPPPPRKKPKFSFQVDVDVDLTLDSDSEEDDCLIIEPPSTPPPVALRIDRSTASYDRFAFSAKELEEEETEMILGLLTMDELTTLAKKMKCDLKSGKTRSAVTAALLKTSSQSTLSFTPVNSKRNSAKEVGGSAGRLGVGYDGKGRKLSQSGIVKAAALKLIGGIIFLHPSYRTLFDRLCLVYHRTPFLPSKLSRPGSASSFTSSLLARFGKRTYPKYKVNRTFEIFHSRQSLLDYEIALELNRDVEECLEGVYYGFAGMDLEGSGKSGGGGSGSGSGKGGGWKERTKEEKDELKKKNWEKGIEVYEGVKEKWKKFCVEEDLKEEEDGGGFKDEDGEGRAGLLYYRMRFHPGWPLTRLMYKAAAIFGRMGERKKEMSILRSLLNQKTFRRGKRGAWYDRLALLIMHYPGEKEEVAEGSSKEGLRVKRLEKAKKVCQEGLEDRFTHLIYHSSLQRRITRLESLLKVPEEDRTTFDTVLTKARERVMEGERLDEAIVGKKSVWRANDGEEISVEELALEQYVKEGWKGFHSENGVLTTIFSLVFWDILFAPVDGVFETQFQSAPLDLATDAFAIVRRHLIDTRLEEIRAGKASGYLTITDDRERSLATFCVGVNWEKYSKEDLLEIVECIGGTALAKILVMFVEEYGHRTGGIPDLCLWNPSLSTCLFSEVKGPGDTLSETQKTWLDVLLASGVEVEVCKVWTSEERIKAEKVREEKKRGGGKGRGRKRGRKKGSESAVESDEED